MENNIMELGNEQVTELATQAVQAVTQQAMPEATEIAQTVAENSGMPGWAKALLFLGGGSILGFLARMGWTKWITPKLKKAALERKVMKETKKAVKAAVAQTVQQTKADAAAKKEPTEPVVEVDPNDVDLKID